MIPHNKRSEIYKYLFLKKNKKLDKNVCQIG